MQGAVRRTPRSKPEVARASWCPAAWQWRKQKRRKGHPRFQSARRSRLESAGGGLSAGSAAAAGGCFAEYFPAGPFSRLALTTAAKISVMSSPSNNFVPGKHFVKHAAERPDVVRLVDIFALRLLFGRDVRCGAQDHSLLVAPRLSVGELRMSAFAASSFERLRQSEVQYLHFAFRRHFHVGWFEVPVDDVFSCASSSASAICEAIFSASSTGTGPSSPDPPASPRARVP